MANYPASKASDHEHAVDVDLSDLSIARGHSDHGVKTLSPLLILSRQPSLIDTVRKSAPPGMRTVVAPSLDEVAGQLATLQPGVLLVDTDSVSDLKSMVVQLTQHFPDLVVVVAGKSEESQELMRLAAAGQVYRFLLQPLSQGQTKITLDAALKQHKDLLSTAKRLASGDGGEAKKNPIVAYAAIGVGLLALIVGIWVFMSKTNLRSDAEQTVAGGAQQSPAQAELALAKTAFDAGKLVEPAGESALDLYRSALSIDPSSQAARDGVRAVTDKVLERAEKALLGEKLEEAVASLELARDIQADHPRLTFLDKQIARERERLKLTQAQEIGARVRNLLTQAAQRIDAGKLIAPEGSSARDSLAEARKLDPTDPNIQQSIRDLANRVVEAAKQATASGNLEQAQSLANAARQLGYAGAALSNVERDVRTVASKRATAESEVALTRKRIADGQLIEPANDSARDHLAAARAADAPRADIADLSALLTNRLVEQGRQALTAQQYDRVRQLVAAARETGVRSQDAALAQLEREVDAQRRSAAPAAASNATSPQLATGVKLKRTRTVMPVLPEDARRKGISGWVEVAYTVNSSGAVEEAEVSNSSPAAVFDEAALKAVRAWRFEPPTLDGKPVATRGSIRLKFDPTM